MTDSDVSFLDRFVLHLATCLRGETPVLDFLEAKVRAPDTRPLYWRSPLLVEIATKTDLVEDETLLFVDFEVDLGLESESDVSASARLQIRFGCYFLTKTTEKNEQQQDTSGTTSTKDESTHTTGLYVQSKPLTMTQLENHCEGVGIDLQSGAPKALAKMLGISLSKIQSSKADSSNMALTLQYPDIQETGDLQLDISETTTGFDKLGLAMFFQNLVRRIDEKTNPSETSAPLRNPEESLHTCLEKYKKLRRRQEQQANNTAMGPVTSQAAPADTTNSAAPSKKRTHSTGPYVPIASRKKKKKKGTLAYAQDAP